MIRKLLIYLAPHRAKLALVLFVLIAGAALESLGISLFVPLIVALSATPGSTAPSGAGVFSSYLHLFDGVPQNLKVQLIILLLVGCILVKNALAYAGRFLAIRLELSAIRDFRIHLFDRYMAAPYHFFLSRKHGHLVSELFDDTVLGGQALSTLVGVLANVLTVTALYALLILLSWQATAVATVVFAVLSVGLQWLSGVATRIGTWRRSIARDLVAYGSEVLQGIRQVKIFSAETRVVEHFTASAGLLSRANLRLRSVGALAQPLAETFAVVAMGIFIMAVVSTSASMAAVPFLVTFLIVLGRLLPIVASINRDVINLKAETTAVNSLFESLSQVPVAEASVKGRQFAASWKAIRFESVVFAYPGQIQNVLQGVTVDLQKGECLAVVGPSGAGKSTVIDVLLRLYDPTEGRIAVDGIDLRAYDLESWRRRIGFVSQDTFVFNASIRDNIAFALPGATSEEIVTAAKQADAHEFILQLPNGYDSVVGDRGFRLSGGQRQRIAIARAVIRKPDILLFDEATSSLDTESEQRVQQAINRLSKDRTVVIVAHRLSTVVNAARIIVLDQGRVVEHGTHASLLAERGLYWRLYSTNGSATGNVELEEAGVKTGGPRLRS
ncbi:MAG: ABC transporter ATP-binding protein [Desulfobacteraceae bacterium]|nr:MAG: ABC transporter ATP-binding protein [Desulfobacteraceae bacterium]